MNDHNDPEYVTVNEDGSVTVGTNEPKPGSNTVTVESTTGSNTVTVE